MSIRVSSLVWEHAPVSGTDLLVLLVIADHASDDGTNAWPSRATIARKARVTGRSVKRSLANLRELGLIDVQLQAGGTADMPRSTRPNRYRVAVEKLNDGGTPVSPGGDASVPRGGTPAVDRGGRQCPPNRPSSIQELRARDDERDPALWIGEDGRAYA